MPRGHLDAAWFGGLAVALALALIGIVLIRKTRRYVRRYRDGEAMIYIAGVYRTPRRYHQPLPVRPVMPITPDAWACTVAPGCGSSPAPLGYGPGAAGDETAYGHSLAQRSGAQLYRDPYAGSIEVPHDPWKALYSSMAVRGQRPPREP